MRLRKLVEDIGEPQEFRSWEYLLVVEGSTRATKGKLVIIGGGHRLLSSSLVLHTLVLPYKVVSFHGIGTTDVPFSIFDHEGPVVFHIEVSETRPEKYRFMEQVRLYGFLKKRWRKEELKRVSNLRGRRGRPRPVSHRKLYQYYGKMASSTVSNCRWAIEFMMTNTHNTRRHYMSGADRLLESGVVPYLSYLESIGTATFNKATLNAVRNWSVDKVRKVVGLWKVRHDTGLKVQFVFSDRVGREVDGRGRGRRSTQDRGHSTDSELYEKDAKMEEEDRGCSLKEGEMNGEPSSTSAPAVPSPEAAEIPQKSAPDGAANQGNGSKVEQTGKTGEASDKPPVESKEAEAAKLNQPMSVVSDLISVKTHVENSGGTTEVQRSCTEPDEPVCEGAPIAAEDVNEVPVECTRKDITSEGLPHKEDFSSNQLCEGNALPALERALQPKQHDNRREPNQEQQVGATAALISEKCGEPTEKSGALDVTDNLPTLIGGKCSLDVIHDGSRHKRNFSCSNSDEEKLKSAFEETIPTADQGDSIKANQEQQGAGTSVQLEKPSDPTEVDHAHDETKDAPQLMDGKCSLDAVSGGAFIESGSQSGLRMEGASRCKKDIESQLKGPTRAPAPSSSPYCSSHEPGEMKAIIAEPKDHCSSNAGVEPPSQAEGTNAINYGEAPALSLSPTQLTLPHPVLTQPTPSQVGPCLGQEQFSTYLSHALLERDSNATSDAARRLLIRLEERKMKITAVDVDLETDISVVKRVLNKLTSEGDRVQVKLSNIVRDMQKELNAIYSSEVKLVVEGGAFKTPITLRAEDFDAIRQFHLATDTAVLFTLSFLTRWSGESDVVSSVVDPILTSGWWDEELGKDHDRFEALREAFSWSHASIQSVGERIWNTDVCFMPICGRGHWSLVVIVNLRALHAKLEPGGPVAGKEAKRPARVYFVDSIGKDSPHSTIAANTYYLLQASYPGSTDQTVQRIKEVVKGHNLRYKLQQNEECGFYVGYHTSILSRVLSDLVQKSPTQVIVLLKEGRSCYTFSQYQDDIQSRLVYISNEYSNGQKRGFHIPLWSWNSEERAPHDVSKEESTLQTRGSLGKRPACDNFDNRDLKRQVSEAKSGLAQGKYYSVPLQGQQGIPMDVSRRKESRRSSEWIRGLIADVLAAVQYRNHERLPPNQEGVHQMPSDEHQNTATKPITSEVLKGAGTGDLEFSLETTSPLPSHELRRAVEEVLVLEKKVSNCDILRDWEACKRKVYELMLAMREECNTLPDYACHTKT